MMPPKGYIHISERINALDYLRKTDLFLSSMDDPFRWKWVCISLSSAFYGFMISVLTFGSPYNVIDWSKLPAPYRKRLNQIPPNDTADNYEKKREIKDEYVNKGNPQLIGYEEALKRIQDSQHFHLNVVANPIDITAEEMNSVMFIRRFFRNEFEHFLPKSWGIEELYFIPHLKNLNVVIRKLLKNNVHIYNDDVTKEECLDLVEKIDTMLNSQEETLKELQTTRNIS